VLFPEGVLVLNATAAAVLERCDGGATITEIVAALDECYRGVSDAEIRTLLDALRRRRLLAIQPDEMSGA
jgi:coenzyme PQQ biosynthesis protein PqqD